MSHKLSYRQAYFKGNYTSYAEAESFLMQNDRFVREKINNVEDDWWAEIAIVWAQLDGLVAGNAAACGQNCLSLLDFLFFQAEQDIYKRRESSLCRGRVDSEARCRVHPRDLPLLFHHQVRFGFRQKYLMEYVAVAGIASSNLRLAPNNSDLFVGHNTWTGYYSMLRLLKDSNRGPWDTSFCYLRVPHYIESRMCPQALC